MHHFTDLNVLANESVLSSDGNDRQVWLLSESAIAKHLASQSGVTTGNQARLIKPKTPDSKANRRSGPLSKKFELPVSCQWSLAT